ncbi:MAG TPA: 5-dehydro-4-deoxy-D-glucuronate isomerase [Clostridia bacterium]|nr:5-dehydro-4-deoxy-D-glucuronate isomerase [Clostridia bacterium]
MKLDVRYANHPEDSKHYDTETLRRHFLIERVFAPDEVLLTYSHQDRIIAGGAMPVNLPLELTGSKELAAEHFLEHRELGVINIGGDGRVILDGKDYPVARHEGLYAGMGTKQVAFLSLDPSNPAKFYINSCPAHHSYPNKIIGIRDAVNIPTGDPANVNRRVIHQFVHPAVCESCQLAMGMTVLEAGSVWNTMPCHTHERRMEVYFYFDMGQDDAVFHIMGRKDETRHIVMRNEQAVLSPSWSIHSGVGTRSYTFIWGMCGENKTFTDMDDIPMSELT